MERKYLAHRRASVLVWREYMSSLIQVTGIWTRGLFSAKLLFWAAGCWQRRESRNGPRNFWKFRWGYWVKWVLPSTFGTQSTLDADPSEYGNARVVSVKGCRFLDHLIDIS